MPFYLQTDGGAFVYVADATPYDIPGSGAANSYAVRPVGTEVSIGAAAAYSPEWYGPNSSGNAALASYGTAYDGVPNSGIKQATIIFTYAPGAGDTGAAARILVIDEILEVYITGGIMYFRLLNTTVYFSWNIASVVPAYTSNEFVFVVVFDTENAAIGDRIKMRAHNITTGTGYTVTATAGPAENADLTLLRDIGVPTTIYGKTALGGNGVVNGFIERVQVISGAAADITDITEIVDGTTLKDPSGWSSVPASASVEVTPANLDDGQLVIELIGSAGLITGTNTGLGAGTEGSPTAGPDFVKGGPGTLSLRA